MLTRYLNLLFEPGKLWDEKKYIYFYNFDRNSIFFFLSIRIVFNEYIRSFVPGKCPYLNLLSREIDINCWAPILGWVTWWTSCFESFSLHFYLFVLLYFFYFFFSFFPSISILVREIVDPIDEVCQAARSIVLLASNFLRN